MKYGIIIPNYNHGDKLEVLFDALMRFDLPCILIDDGSDSATKRAIDRACDRYDFIDLITLSENRGKGAAMIVGFHRAQAQGWSHAVQVDADMQHEIADIGRLLQESRNHPRSLISGLPIYDERIPKSRLYGRKITNFWVMIETWNKQLPESMCGFRVYPLVMLNKIRLDKIGRRMDFDIEILVRLFWQGVGVRYIPTPVYYPSDGKSNFRFFSDNVRISLMHTRLVLKSLVTMPRHALLLRKKTKKHNAHQHWSTTKEKGGYFLLRLSFGLYRCLGRRLSTLLLLPVIAYYCCFAKTARKASLDYRKRLRLFCRQQGVNEAKLTRFRHFYAFFQVMLDKLSLWQNGIDYDRVDFSEKSLLTRLIKEKRGAVLLTAHLGNMEVLRVLGQRNPELKINVLVFSEHAQKFNRLLNRLNPQASLNLIETRTFDMAMAISLKSCVDQGEFVIIAADRTSTRQPERVINANFLSDQAPFPLGAFMLAYVLEVSVYFMICVKTDKKRFRVIMEEIEVKRNSESGKAKRMLKLQQMCDQYSQKLACYCRKYPAQWFNFFDFWHHK
ncbi:MAG: glycosyltransferase family 2 protein [Francisellaceae bacterium]